MESLKFSSTVGQNITVSNSRSTATWDMKHSGGHIYSKDPIRPGQKISIIFEGSGHCSIGYTTEDPNTSLRSGESVFLKTSKFHKNVIHIQLSIRDDGCEGVLSWLGDKDSVVKESFKLPKKKQVWLSLDLRFGLATITSHHLGSSETAVEFSSNHGANLNLNDHNTRVKSINQSPASTCFLKNEISHGDVLVLNCAPVLENGRTPSRYYLKLYAFDRDPASLKGQFKYLLDANAAPTNNPPPLTAIDQLTKEACKGSVSVYVINPSVLGYTTATEKYNQVQIRATASGGVWVVLELFRVSVTAKRRRRLPLKPNSNVVDGMITEPWNELAENTLLPFYSLDENTSLKRVVDHASNIESGFNSSAKYQDINNVNPKSTMVSTTVERRLEACERSQNEIREGVDFIKTVLTSTSTPPTAATSNITAQRNINLNATSTNAFNVPPGSRQRNINTRSYFTSLVRDLDCMPLLDKLFEKHLITQTDYDSLANLGDRTVQNRTLLRLLSQKNISKATMDKILDSIEQGHLKELF